MKKSTPVLLATVLVITPIILGARITRWRQTQDAFASGTRVAEYTPGNYKLTVTVEDTPREYILHLPQHYTGKSPLPIVIMFHGGGGTARNAIWQTEWAKKADQEHFLAVFPEGTPHDPSRPASFRRNPQTWNDGSERIGAAARHVADVAFVAAMLNDLKERFTIDARRIYVTGFSNGASMSFRVARELSQVIAAMAPVAGADWLGDTPPGRAVPLLYITGTADPQNPFEGGEVRIGATSYGQKASTQDMIANWVTIHGCSDEPRVVYEQEGETGKAYCRHNGVDTMVVYTIVGHGHHWPGGRSALPERVAGKNVATLNATDVIWDFFQKHSK